MRLSLWGIALLAAIKIFQLLNSFVFSIFLGAANGPYILTYSLCILVVLFLVGFILKNPYSPQRIKYYGVIGLLLVLLIFIKPELLIIFLFSIFYFACIIGEFQVLQSLGSIYNFPPAVPFLFSLLSGGLIYIAEPSLFATPIILYLVNGGFVLLASYAIRTAESGKAIIFEQQPPLLMGLLFMVAAGALYFITKVSSTENISVVELAFIMLFYAGGVLAVYGAIDARLRQMPQPKQSI